MEGAGVHLILDGYFKSSSPLISGDNTKTFLLSLADVLSLEPAADPIVFPFNLPEEFKNKLTHLSDPIGISAILILKTSHISLHTWAEIESSPGSNDHFVSLDIFSCKPFPLKDTLRFLKDNQIAIGRYCFIERNFHDLPAVLELDEYNVAGK